MPGSKHRGMKFHLYLHSKDLHGRELKVKFGDWDVMTLNQTTMRSIFILLQQCMLI